MPESNFTPATTAKLYDFPKDPLNSGGGDGTFDDMEARVKRLEDDMHEIKKDLKALLIDTAEIKGTLKGMPSATTLGEMKGRVDGLPTLSKIATLVGLATGVIVVLNNLSSLKAIFIH